MAAPLHPEERDALERLSGALHNSYEWLERSVVKEIKQGASLGAHTFKPVIELADIVQDVSDLLPPDVLGEAQALLTQTEADANLLLDSLRTAVDARSRDADDYLEHEAVHLKNINSALTMLQRNFRTLYLPLRERLSVLLGYTQEPGFSSTERKSYPSSSDSG